MVPLNVLLIEDSDDDATLLRRELKRSGFDLTWQQVQTAEDFQAALTTAPWDVVLSDYRLPQFSAPAALEILQQSPYDLPFIVVSGTVGESTAVELMKAGAHDYVMKDNLSRLAEAVRREVREAQIRAERLRTTQELSRTKELLQLAIEGSGIGIWDWHLPSGTVWINDQCAQLVGRSPTDKALARLKTWRRLTHPDDLHKNLVALRRHFQRHSPSYDCELRLHHGQGHWIWVLARGQVVEWDDSRQPQRMSGTFIDITDRKRAEDERHQANAQILYRSLHDTLTDLPNRNFLLQRLELAIQRSHRYPQAQGAVLFLDLDHFKVINDSLGHLAGDEILVAVAQKLRLLTRASDMAARLGGDEFVLLLEDGTSLEEAEAVAQRLLQELQKPLTVKGRDVFLNASLGLVAGLGNYRNPSEPLRDADIAMYRAKAKGRGCYVVFNESMHVQALHRLQLEQELRQAIERQELVLRYQPIVRLDTGQLQGFEALVRWPHPSRGMIAPDSFIPIAEETGLILALDRWVLQTAAHQLAHWLKCYPRWPQLKISFNFSVDDLLHEHLIDELTAILNQTGLQGRHLNVEITESVLVKNMYAMIARLQQIKALGLNVTIDDFGTGYSSLSYLHQLPVDALKIDRSFVMTMDANQRNSDIVETIITLSNRLGLDAIAEGVETEAQLHHLQRLGCELAQGYWFAQPLSAAAAADWLSGAVTPLGRPPTPGG